MRISLVPAGGEMDCPDANRAQQINQMVNKMPNDGHRPFFSCKFKRAFRLAELGFGRAAPRRTPSPLTGKMEANPEPEFNVFPNILFAKFVAKKHYLIVQQPEDEFIPTRATLIDRLKN